MLLRQAVSVLFIYRWTVICITKQHFDSLAQNSDKPTVLHISYQCPALSTTRVTFFQRFSDNHLEFGDDHFANMSNLLKKEHIVSMGLFNKSLYKERQCIMYMWWSLKCVNKQHCPHCALLLSFISVLFWFILIIIFIPVLEALEVNHFEINYCLPMFAFALAQTATTHNHSFKWIETCRPQWSGAQRQAHFNCVYRYVAGLSQT